MGTLYAVRSPKGGQEWYTDQATGACFKHLYKAFGTWSSSAALAYMGFTADPETLDANPEECLEIVEEDATVELGVLWTKSICRQVAATSS